MKRKWRSKRMKINTRMEEIGGKKSEARESYNKEKILEKIENQQKNRKLII